MDDRKILVVIGNRNMQNAKRGAAYRITPRSTLIRSLPSYCATMENFTEGTTGYMTAWKT